MISSRLLSDFWKYLSIKRKKQVVIFLIISTISGIFELITISAILPFISVLTKGSEGLSNYPISNLLSKILGIPINSEIFVPIILFFAFSIIISTLLRLLNIGLNEYIAAHIGNDLNKQAIFNILHQPYIFHINSNSSEFITALTQYINRTTGGIIFFLQFISNLILSLMISIGVFYINPLLTTSAFLIITIFYIIVIRNLNRNVSLNSKNILQSLGSKVKSLQEVLGAIRVVLIESNQKIYIRNIQRLDLKARRLNAQNRLIAESPRFILECIALLSIALVSFFTINNLEFNKSSSFIIILGSFALGIQRLLPSIQKLYSAWVNINSVSSDMEKILEILRLGVINSIENKVLPINFKESIKFEGVYFSYNQKKDVISNLNLEILKGQTIGIIGKTGSGKSTLIDLMMGLLKPKMGKIYVDGKDIHSENYKSRKNKWMRSISHVPQDIYLTDGTISENIAFEINPKLISKRRVIEAAKRSKIHEFIKSIPDGYNSYVGERGIKLSGGQRQRIGIARALYKKSEIIIFDEATSALDNETEIKLMKEINKLKGKITFISIAHRYSTLEKCDRILKIEEGTVVSDQN